MVVASAANAIQEQNPPCKMASRDLSTMAALVGYLQQVLDIP